MQGANPSAEELARAVEATGSEDVILLPNNKNVVPAAEKVGELVDTRTYVIPFSSPASKPTITASPHAMLVVGIT